MAVDQRQGAERSHRTQIQRRLCILRIDAAGARGIGIRDPEGRLFHEYVHDVGRGTLLDGLGADDCDRRGRIETRGLQARAGDGDFFKLQFSAFTGCRRLRCLRGRMDCKETQQPTDPACPKLFLSLHGHVCLPRNAQHTCRVDGTGQTGVAQQDPEGLSSTKLAMKRVGRELTE